MARFEVPCIDLSDDVDLVAKLIDDALKKYGLFFVCNHGIEQKLIDNMWRLTRAFHSQPLTAKLPLAAPFGSNGYIDNKTEAMFENSFPESSGRAAQNKWPDESADDLKGFYEGCVNYSRAVDDLGRRLLPLLERAMGIPSGYLTDAFRDAQYFLNIRHYPDQGVGAQRVCCVPPHTDSGVLTFLPQQGKPGFEVCLPDGSWVPVRIDLSSSASAVGDGDAGTARTIYLVQGGDCLRRWTNHRYQSALHRVAPHPGSGDRYAMPLFWGPGETYLMRTLPGCADAASNPERYPTPITYAEYITAFAKAENEGVLGEFSTIRSLTDAQKRAAKENRVDGVAQGNVYDRNAATSAPLSPGAAGQPECEADRAASRGDEEEGGEKRQRLQ